MPSPENKSQASSLLSELEDTLELLGDSLPDNYETYLKQINFMWGKISGGLTLDDMPDYCFLACYKAGDSIGEALESAIFYWNDY